ncbi:unnamed protein product, partial [marine sediment metagenome]
QSIEEGPLERGGALLLIIRDDYSATKDVVLVPES